MAAGAPSSSPSPILAALFFSSLVLSPVQAIVVYTDKEVHGAVGSQVTLYCSFWSSEWVSDDLSFTWRYQPEGGRDAISIFHYAKGQPYIDEVGTFKERIQWVGDPYRKDGSIVIHNLDYSDNGTFTCDVKNPPDIVGKTSQVTLYVFEKVPTRYGVVLGAVIGGVLGVVLLALLLFYLIRYCWLRRQAALQRRLSAMEKGKLHKAAKDSSKRGRQVSGTWEAAGQPSRAGWEQSGPTGRVPDACAPPRRRRCCTPCWTTAEAPKLPVRRRLKGWGSLARIRNSG
ncbi:myelin protein P0 isoform 1-T1 [Dama dama]|uniref:myelin protein P0 isoform X1 n=1 Tax=Dama dama TaxID=30532 RepID=UPI002A371042|nr:myelin protein P0 isoform X1 [Dama dama]